MKEILNVRHTDGTVGVRVIKTDLEIAYMNRRSCEARSPADWVCTLEVGHSGRHVAASWDDDGACTTIEVMSTWGGCTCDE